MRAELVAPGDLESAFADWTALFRVDDLATPFSSPCWARAWLGQWNSAAEPWVMRVRDGERVAGIVPLALRLRRGVRILSMLGKEPGDYWDVISASEDREGVAVAAATELERLRSGWDVLVLSCLQPESRTLAGFEMSGLEVVRRSAVQSPAIDLPGTFDEYLASLPRSRRQSLRKHLRRLDSGEISLREVRDTAEVGAVMERWWLLRSRQWREMDRKITPVHEQDHFYRFMVDSASRMVGAGLAVLWELTHDRRVVGVYLNFADARSFYWYLGGFDPDFARLGLGKIAIGAGIRSSIAAGRQRYDFTRGGDPYKYWYGATDRALPSVFVGHRGARSRLVLAGARALSAYRARSMASRGVSSSGAAF
jgi:CelD/BcsL family acetyltransferase involved in cellulose biosynthesis